MYLQQDNFMLCWNEQDTGPSLFTLFCISVDFFYFVVKLLKAAFVGETITCIVIYLSVQ